MHSSHLRWSRPVPNHSWGLGETPEAILIGLRQDGGFQPTPFLWIKRFEDMFIRMKSGRGLPKELLKCLEEKKVV
jgi:hypothetical protein